MNGDVNYICEGHRRDDLIRHGKYIEYARKDGMDAKDYHILFPIPQKALNENSNLKTEIPDTKN